jgi:tape measure domain-containing protein
MSNQNLKYTLSLQDLFTGKMNAAIKQTQRMDSAFSKIGSTIAAIGVGVGIKNVIDTTAKFQSLENAIKATGDAKNLQFLNEQVDRLGLDINAAYSGFKTFSGALMGTTLAGEQGNKVFRQVSEAATVMGLSGEQTEGAFLALGQMMSKGTVSAEELRGQLGERIPGAFQIAAKAMGVTTSALGDMMKKGEVVAEDFLPKFGNELEKRFGGQAKKASESLQANLNRLNTEWIRLKVTLGNSLMPIIIKVSKVLVGLVKVLSALMPLIKIGVILIGSYYVKMKLATWSTFQFALAQRAMAMGMSKSAVAAGFLKRGIQGISAAFKAIPILGWVLALVDGINYLWDKFSGFRESVYAFLNVFSNMGKVIKLNFQGIGLMLESVLTRNQDKMKEALMKFSEADGIQKGAALSGIIKGKKEFNAENGIGGALGGSMGATGGVDANGNTSGKGLGSGTEVSGARPQSLTINIEKLVEKLEISTQNIQGGYAQIKEQVTKVLLESVNDLNMITR